eukprot:464674-Pyramimonas_sp.AAC.1
MHVVRSDVALATEAALTAYCNPPANFLRGQENTRRAPRPGGRVRARASRSERRKASRLITSAELREKQWVDECMAARIQRCGARMEYL